ncbi:MAG: sulfatase [Thermoanaerobaculia bacterium]
MDREAVAFATVSRRRRISRSAARPTRCAAWALLLLATSAACTRQPPAVDLPAQPNLVLYLIDTLRADHLGCYGYAPPVSPRIDSFARESVLVREARAQSSWTKPAVATILTGLTPPGHGTERRSHRLPKRVETLAERLGSAGYVTAMFTTNPTVTERFGFDQGFDEFHYLSQPRGRRRGHVDSAEIHGSVVDWLDRRSDGRPFFLVVHTLDPHDPYRPREPFASRLAAGIDIESACCPKPAQLAGLTEAELVDRSRRSIALYDAEIAQNDESFGRLRDVIERRGLGPRTAILLTADHGEEFFEHGGWRHGHALYEELLRIPFVLRLPGGAAAGRVVDGPIDQIDFTPTLLDLAGIGPVDGLPGESWLPWLMGRGDPPAGAATSFAWLEHPAYSMAAAQAGEWKWIGRWNRGDDPPAPPVEWLFDLARDPAEVAPRGSADGADGHRRELVALLAAARRQAGSAMAAEEEEIDPELDRTLRALGYI